MFRVEIWGSAPELGNDDHWTGREFETEQEARKFMAQDRDEFEECTGCVTLEVDNADGSSSELDRRHMDRKVVDCYQYDRSEHRMQEAMGRGIDGWNEN